MTDILKFINEFDFKLCGSIVKNRLKAWRLESYKAGSLDVRLVQRLFVWVCG
jgi:hypothetical protein